MFVACSSKLVYQPYKIPKSIELVDHIPVNENGKVVRSKLVEESLAKGY